MTSKLPLGLLKLFSYTFLMWESIWRSFWPLAVFVGIFVAVLLMDLLPSLNWLVHYGVLAVTGLAGLYLVFRSIKRCKLPKWQDATRRIEADSKLPHRPLSSLADVPLDKNSALWKAHKRRLQQTAKNLKLSVPTPGVPAADTMAFRIVPLILLVIAVPLAWGTSWARIDRGLSPQPPAEVPPEPYAIDAWVSPPSYTGLPPILVEVAAVGDTATIKAPEQSEILLQIQGGTTDPDLQPSLWQQTGDTQQNLDFERSNQGQNATGTWRFDGLMQQTAALAIFKGPTPAEENRLVRIETSLVADIPPILEHVEDPRTTDAGSLRLAILGADDYGLKDLNLTVDPASTHVGIGEFLGNLMNGYIKGEDLAQMRKDAKKPEEPETLSELVLLYRDIPLGLPGNSPTNMDFTEFLDMAAHPLAGKEVELSLSVSDYADQTTSAEPKKVKLPKREFEDPIAKQVAKLRERIFKRPESKNGAAIALAALSEADSLTEDKSSGVRKALNDLSVQTLEADDLAELDQIVRQLWDLAKRLDDNPVRRAEEKLRKIEEQLRDALERGAPEEELMVLMDQLREAMEEYRTAVINQKLMEMLENGELNVAKDKGPNRDAMEDLASRLESMARKGAREQALELLDELKEMMENLANADLELQLEGEGSGGGQGQSMAMEMMSEMADIMRQQQSLLNDSFRQQQQGMPSNQERDRENAYKQEELRRRLGDTMRNLGRMFGGELPDGLGQAERAMKDAVRGLRQGDRDKTLDGQSRALNELQRSAQAMAEMMAQEGEGGGQSGSGSGGGSGSGSGGPGGSGGQMGQGGDGEGQGEGDQGSGTDPLGRSYSQGSDPMDLTLEQSRRASRDIRDELRRRAGDPNRSAEEQSYIDKLLKEF